MTNCLIFYGSIFDAVKELLENEVPLEVWVPRVTLVCQAQLVPPEGLDLAVRGFVASGFFSFHASAFVCRFKRKLTAYIQLQEQIFD